MKRSPDERIQLAPVSQRRIDSALAKSQRLLHAAQAPMAALERALSATPVRAMLSDADGIVIMSTAPSADESQMLRAAARLGVTLTEPFTGTGAPAVATHMGQACMVRGGEHFFQCLSRLHCAAAPIRNGQGRLAGVLNLSADVPFGFDAVMLVHGHASWIENQLMASMPGAAFVLQLHCHQQTLDTPVAGVALFDEAGKLLGLNAIGAQLCRPADAPVPDTITQAADLALSADTLNRLATLAQPAWHVLPTGLGLWLKAGFTPAHARARAGETRSGVRKLPSSPTSSLVCATPPDNDEVGRASSRATPTNASPIPHRPALPSGASTLDTMNRRLIESTLSQCQGNIAKTARKLGVSRGLIYRALKRRAESRD
ncbi:MAG: helix-turn-helix domain-containing protein [Lautropia sp.]|nr:helix-turn-helix domain-containing protein [Lautropia sp.]